MSWHRKWLFKCAVAQELVVQACHGTGNGCSSVLWHRNWLFRCVMAQEMVVQVCCGTGMVVQVWCIIEEIQVMQLCYGTESHCEDVLWHRNRL